MILKSLKKNCQAMKSCKYYIKNISDIKIKLKKISDKEYEHVRKVWNTFQMKTMKVYHDWYLK